MNPTSIQRLNRAVLVVCGVVLVLLTAGATEARAQGDVHIEIEGLAPDSDVTVALAFANLNKATPPATAAAGGSLDFIADFANMGKSPVEAQNATQVFVYYDRCQEPRQLLFSDTPRDDADCRDPLGIILMSSRTTRVVVNLATMTTRAETRSTAGLFGPRLTIGFGIDFNRYPEAAGNVQPAMGTIEGGIIRRREFLDLKDSQADLGISVDYWVAPWLAAGLSWERMGEVALTERFVFDQFPGAEETFDSSFDVQSVDFIVKPALPIGNRIMVFGIGGVMKWWGESGGQAQRTFNGQLIEEFTLQQNDGGMAGVLGGGLSIWPTSTVGVSAYFKQAQLKDSDKTGAETPVDETFRKVGISVLIKLW